MPGEKTGEKFYITTAIDYVCRPVPPGDAHVGIMTELTKEQLQDLYITKGLSTWKIERLSGRSRSFVYAQLRKFGIPPRDISDSHVHYERKPFGGSGADKAYLIGFTIGDLRVRRNGGSRSKTISIACASTKPAQIELIERLYMPYGRIWKSRPNSRGVVSIEAFVDLSFGFLLPQNIKEGVDSIFTKIFIKDEYFLSFIAGFTDAEGSAFISKNQATLSWGNYNQKILKRTKVKLAEMGIRTRKIVCDHLTGYQGKDGYRRSADYYHLSCGRKESLWRLLILLNPLLRHIDRRKAVERALRNIRIRNRMYGFINFAKKL